MLSQSFLKLKLPDRRHSRVTPFPDDSSVCLFTCGNCPRCLCAVCASASSLTRSVPMISYCGLFIKLLIVTVGLPPPFYNLLPHMRGIQKVTKVTDDGVPCLRDGCTGYQNAHYQERYFKKSAPAAISMDKPYIPSL